MGHSVVNSLKSTAKPAVTAGAKTEVIAGKYPPGLGIGADVRSGEAMALPIDSVYFLLFPGWRTQVRSDRWYYAQRWARHVPVVLVDPELPAAAPAHGRGDPHIDNAEVLSVREHIWRASFHRGLVQAGQIIGYMRERNHRRPLLWLYNPNLAFAYGLVPAVGRIYFGNENFFEFDEHPDFHSVTRAAVAISDKIICGSLALLERLRSETGREDPEFIPNGCDYAMYASPKPVLGGWTELLQPAVAAGTPIAVFAGGINNQRLDFAQLHRLAETLEDVHFVYAGPVNFLEAGDEAAWKALLGCPNVSYIGFLDAADLPWLYRLADRGFMPYRPHSFIVKNPIPLKALEMAAAGLPVVSTRMESLLAVADAVTVAENEADFIAKLRAASRGTRSPEAATRADAVCRRHDYDRLFEKALATVLGAKLNAPPTPASLAQIYDYVPVEAALWETNESEAYGSEIDRLNRVYSNEITRLDHMVSETRRIALPVICFQRFIQRILKAIFVLGLLSGDRLGRMVLVEMAKTKRIGWALPTQLAQVIAARREKTRGVRPKGRLLLVGSGSSIILRAAAGREPPHNNVMSPADLVAGLETGRVEEMALVLDQKTGRRCPLLQLDSYDLRDLLGWLREQPERVFRLGLVPR